MQGHGQFVFLISFYLLPSFPNLPIEGEEGLGVGEGLFLLHCNLLAVHDEDALLSLAYTLTTQVVDGFTIEH